jgi:superfamily I DNA and/or RNA helicase/very-short-patch-repair endonuclease
LLHQLAEGIENLPELPPLIEPILHKPNSFAIPLAEQNSVDVADGLSRLKTPWTRFLWGPPGAGKTFALGHLITRLLQIELSGSILLVAPSNRAVDVAVEQLINQIESSEMQQIVEQRKILRFGYPKKTQIIERPELLGPPELDELNKRVKTLSTQIITDEREKSSTADIALLRAEMLATQEEVKNAVETHIKQSLVVATTVTLAYLKSSPIHNYTWNSVLIDEVTMVTPAMCTFLSSLAEERLLLAGDPQQLGPVYEDSQRASKEDWEWMGRDIFDKSGISYGEGISRIIKTNDCRLTRITSQRRCAPAIWSRVEHLYPEVHNLTNEEQLKKLIELPPCSGHAIVVLDTSVSTEIAKCEKVHHSWKNEYTAELAMEVASIIAAENRDNISIAIISPYRAQVRLLRKWIKQEQKAENSPYKALEFDSGTVHQFQGSDADVVIFDLVDGIGRSGLGKLLKGDTGIRLVNVAITRAKGKFIVLANKAWCKYAFDKSDNPILWELILERDASEELKVTPKPDINFEKLESPIEKTLYNAIHNYDDLAKNVESQFIIRDGLGNPISRADLAFPKLKYAVYCDGRQWHLKADKWERDWRQRNRLTELGWIFSVFTGRDIHNNRNECAALIAKTYRSRMESTKRQRV